MDFKLLLVTVCQLLGGHQYMVLVLVDPALGTQCRVVVYPVNYVAPLDVPKKILIRVVVQTDGIRDDVL